MSLTRAQQAGLIALEIAGLAGAAILTWRRNKDGQPHPAPTLGQAILDGAMDSAPALSSRP